MAALVPLSLIFTFTLKMENLILNYLRKEIILASNVKTKMRKCGESNFP